MAGLKNRSLFKLSSGEKQQIALASAYAMQPDIYVLDEPSANLDKTATLALKDMLRKLKARGKTIVISEHRLSFLMNLADRILYIRDGHIQYDWTAREILQLDEERLHMLGLRALQAVDLPTRLMQKAAPTSIESPPILEVRQLCATLGGTKILTGVSFSVMAGEILGIAGKNGIGKTTLARVLCGVCRESGGEIWIDGKKRRRRQRSKLFSFVMQDADYQLFTESVEDELRFGNTRMPDLEEKINETLTLLDLESYRQRHPLSLSGGQKQRVTIAAAAVSAAPLIIFDEPTSGLDGEHMRKVDAVLRSLKERGKTILVISHDTEFLSIACDRVFTIFPHR
jgi:energy-coupling factor transport system ATP-binding protein